ncbi:MAG TPA: DsbA family protein [Solirubrobacteraceae bacterium]|nr:DsbA family protein [Solirubrobacteraceae bacterium]
MAGHAQPIFYYDLGCPACYLAAERIMAELPVVPEWEPVLWNPVLDPDRAMIEGSAAALDLQPLRWPDPWPPQARTAMLAATYAKRIGRAVAFSLAAFRQAFAGGRDLGDADTILIAAAACEMHPAAVLKGIGMRSVAQALDEASGRARAAGVHALPAVAVGERVYHGAQAIEEAAQELAP